MFRFRFRFVCDNVFFCPGLLQESLDQAETGFTDAEPEEVARRGHHYQTRSRHASIHAKLRDAWRYDKAESNPNKRY